MRDINYNPDFFYRVEFGPEKHLQWFDLGILEHESNGLSGKDSRSWNRIYIRYSDIHHFKGSQQKLQWSAKLWVPFSCEGGQCGRFRGIGEFNISLENPFGSTFGENDITLRFYPGGASTVNILKGGQEVTLRMRPQKKKYLPLFIVQFFRGYGENMLDQDHQNISLRGGIGF